MANTELVAFLCPEIGTKLVAIEAGDRCEPASLPAQPEGTLQFCLKRKGTKYIQAALMPTTCELDDVIDDLLKELGGAYLNASRGVQTDTAADPPEFKRRNNWITFEFSLWPEESSNEGYSSETLREEYPECFEMVDTPYGPKYQEIPGCIPLEAKWKPFFYFCAACSYLSVSIARHNWVTLNNGAFFSSYWIPTAKAIPVDGSDPFTIERERTWNKIDPECCPGEALNLKWTFKVAGQIFTKTVASVVFHTPALTGGEIVDVDFSDNIRRTVTVRLVDGETVSLVPTDFADYSIGSWVYLLRTDESEAKQTDRKTTFVMKNDKEEKSDVQIILSDTNEFRRQEGGTPGHRHALVMNTLLTQAAQRMADDCAAHNTILPGSGPHIGSDGTTPLDRVTATGYLEPSGLDGFSYRVTENLAQGYPADEVVFEGWAHSPGHAENMRDVEVTQIGIAGAIGSDGTPYWCQVFGFITEHVGFPGGYRPLPITVNRLRNPGLVDTGGWDVLTDIDFGPSHFDDEFEVSYQEGKITKAYVDADEADVEIEGVQHTAVPIWYHLPKISGYHSTTVEGGGKVFEKDDTVLVLNIGGSLTIIGFKEGVQL